MPKNREDRSMGQNLVHLKKLSRLVHSSNLTYRDFYRVNQIIEQKQYENFFYASAFSLCLSTAIGQSLRVNKMVRMMITGGMFVAMYGSFQIRCNVLYEKQINVYFEKYGIK